MKLFLSFQIALCILATCVTGYTAPFLSSMPGREWKLVGSLDMTDLTQQCPDSWLRLSGNKELCGKKSNTSSSCDSLKISTYRAPYQAVCGRFRGYQVGSPDAFNVTVHGLEDSYVDGISITYGLPGNRSHIYTLAVGSTETGGNYQLSRCPCAKGKPPPGFVGSDYYCESGNPKPYTDNSEYYYSDPLWDGKNCGGNETACCDPKNLPWLCKNFSASISEDLEIRICSDELRNNENVAIEFFELYIQEIPSLSVTSPSEIYITITISVGIAIAVALIVSLSIGVAVVCLRLAIKRRSNAQPDNPVVEYIAYEDVTHHSNSNNDSETVTLQASPLYELVTEQNYI